MAQIILDSNNNLIQGDFDNATLNNRTKLQTTTTNATTNVYVVPNGSSTSAGVSVANNSSLTNASKIVMATNGTTDTQIISGVNGSGSYLPLSFYTNNALAGQFTTAGNLTVTGTVAGATGTIYPLVSGTAVTLTTQTVVDFTGIPSWVKRVTVILNGVSTNGSSEYRLQLGTSSGVTTSGYNGYSKRFASASFSTSGNTTNGLNVMSLNVASAAVYQGLLEVVNITGNVWVMKSICQSGGDDTCISMSNVTLGSTLDRVRITTVNGTDQFDAGSINILYE